MPVWAWISIGVVGLLGVIFVLSGRALQPVWKLVAKARDAAKAGDRPQALALMAEALSTLENYTSFSRDDVERALDAIAFAESLIGWRPERESSWRHWRAGLGSIREKGGILDGHPHLSPFWWHVRYQPLIAVCEGAGDDELLARVQQLTDGGADVNQTDTVGVTPLVIAAARGHLETVRYLVEHGADVNVRDWRHTPLSAAEANHHPSVAEYLRGLGAERWDVDEEANR